jgi:XPG N-terminal domain
MKVMRDDEGEFLKNGHLLGFFRRICRLLFYKIRPVFVFDGATPALKRLTVAARRRRREVQGAQLRKTAEKLLMSKLKARLMEEERARRAVTAGPKPLGALTLGAADAALRKAKGGRAEGRSAGAKAAAQAGAGPSRPGTSAARSARPAVARAAAGAVPDKAPQGVAGPHAAAVAGAESSQAAVDDFSDKETSDEEITAQAPGMLDSP